MLLSLEYVELVYYEESLTTVNDEQLKEVEEKNYVVYMYELLLKLFLSFRAFNCVIIGRGQLNMS